VLTGIAILIELLLNQDKINPSSNSCAWN